MEYNITLIAAMANNRVIGYKNQVPWHLPQDLKRFKSLTKGRYVVMGRNTFDSLNQKPLPGRVNLVISQTYFENPPFTSLDTHTFFMPSPKTVLEVFGKENLKVIGGQQIYEQFLPLAKTLELTIIPQTYPGDTYFPAYELEFDLCWEEVHPALTYQRYQRRKAIDTQAEIKA